MVQFRPQSREIIAKIVYYGPPLGGKTTNLRTLYSGYPSNTRGELVVVPTGGDRTIFFDFLPIYAGELRGMQLRVQLYTVPGQVHYNSTRQVVLRGVDGVVFVADSQREMLRNNRESWENLKDNLLLQGIALSDMPHVLQYNKRDLQDVVEIGDIDQFLNEFNAPFYEAVATTGIGVEETLQGVVKLVVRSLRDRFRVPVESPSVRREPAPPPRPIVPPQVSPAEAETKPLRRPPGAEERARVFAFTPPPPPAEPPRVTPPPTAPPAAPPELAAPFAEATVTTPADTFSFGPPPEPPPERPPEPPAPVALDLPAVFAEPPEPSPSEAELLPAPVAPPEVVPGPAAALTEPPAASLMSRVFEPVAASSVDSPLKAAASAPESQLPPLDLPLVPFEPPPSVFDSGPVEFEPSPAFDAVAPPVAGAIAPPPEPAPEPPAVAQVEAAAAAPPVLGEEPAPADLARPSVAEAPTPDEGRWELPAPMRLSEIPAATPPVEPEFTPPPLPPLGEPELAAFVEPELSPFAEPPIPAFADLGDPFHFADGAPFAVAPAPVGPPPADDVFAAESAAAPPTAAEPGIAEPEPAEAVAAGAPLVEPPAIAPAALEPLVAEPPLPEPPPVSRVVTASAEEPAFEPAPVFLEPLVLDEIVASPVATTFVEPPAAAPFEAEPPVQAEAVAPPVVEVEATAAADETPFPGAMPPPEVVAEAERAAGAAIQRVIPRALAQYGEVRELELEVPVPSVWVGGKRMTLQLRLTLVPQEEEPGG